MPKGYIIFISLKTLTALIAVDAEVEVEDAAEFVDVDAAVEVEVVAELADAEGDVVVDTDKEAVVPVVEFIGGCSSKSGGSG